MAETTSTTWLTRIELRARGWSKQMCRSLLPPPETTIGSPRNSVAVWSLATIQEMELRPEVQAWIRSTLQERMEQLGHQLPACQCGLLSQLGQMMVRQLAYEVALVAADGNRQAALAMLVARNLSEVDPAALGQILYDLAHSE